MAGEEKTCYKVTAVIDGKAVNGYVLGAGLRAVAEFEKQRAVPFETPRIAAPAAVAAKVPAAGDPPTAEQRPLLPAFGNISGRDLKGRPVNLSGLTGKLLLVCFWSPHSKESLREAVLVTRLVGQYRQQGLNALTVSLSGDRELMGEAIEPVTLPTVFNGSEIAQSYGITYDSIPKTYVLNERREILASGLRGKELENRVRSLMSGR